MLSFSRPVLADLLGQDISFERSRFLRQVVAPVAATALLALCAHISFPLPFTPIPVTMQTFAVILIGMLLGPVAGVFAMVLYLAEGAAGLPVFSPQGPGGIARLTGPSAGYLLAYPLAAFAAARIFALAVRFMPTFPAAWTAAIAADALILVSGAAWLALSLHGSLSGAVQLGVLPFVAGEICKTALLAIVVASLKRPRPQR